MSLPKSLVREQQQTAQNAEVGQWRRAKNATRQTVLAERLEVADTAAKRNKGLLGRSGLEAGTGLWISPCESVHTFFMQFPIDLVYLDRDYRIRKVRSNVGPWRISACLSAHSIIELPAGTIERTQSARGDMIEFSPVEVDRAEPTPAANAGGVSVPDTLVSVESHPL